MYVGCDDIVSIPTKINVIIGSKCHRAIIKIETRILEPSEVTIKQEGKGRRRICRDHQSLIKVQWLVNSFRKL